MLFMFTKQDIRGKSPPEKGVSIGMYRATSVAAKVPLVCTWSFEGVSMGAEPIDKKY